MDFIWSKTVNKMWLAKLFSIIIFLALGLAVVKSDVSSRIVGGSITTIGSYPYVASLLRTNNLIQYSQFCAGTILTYRSILTSASCLDGDLPTRWRIRVGSSWANSGGSVYNASQIIMHPYYNRLNYDSDIAIIKSSSVIVFSSTVRAGVIAGSNYQLLDNTPVLSVGWGTTSYGGSKSEQLRQVAIWTINQSVCGSRYASLGSTVTSNMVCSGWLGVGGRGPCNGDGGGPLLHNGVVVGITSWGYRCAEANYPTVNTRVSRFTTWIQANA